MGQELQEQVNKLQEQVGKLQEQLSQLHEENNKLQAQLRGKKWGPYSQTVCVICLEPLHEQKVCFIPCAHYFHHDCFDAWAQRNYRCPICQADWSADNGAFSAGT